MKIKKFEVTFDFGYDIREIYVEEETEHSVCLCDGVKRVRNTPHSYIVDTYEEAIEVLENKYSKEIKKMEKLRNRAVLLRNRIQELKAINDKPSSECLSWLKERFVRVL